MNDRNRKAVVNAMLAQQDRQGQARLVYLADNKSGKPAGSPVQVGDYVTGLHNSPPEAQFVVTYFRFPASGSSSGKLSLRPVAAAPSASDHEVYVGIIGAEWIDRPDRPPYK